jgi:hypothetical protein
MAMTLLIAVMLAWAVRMMMFGFGDVEHPLQRTVDTVEVR